MAQHEEATARLCREFLQRIDQALAPWGHLLGKWHDLGKYSEAFQTYLRSASGLDAHLESLPGRVDHSTAGAQHAVQRLGTVGRLLAYCIAGHHAGLPDTVDPGGGSSGLEDRLRKNTEPVTGAPPGLLGLPCPNPPQLDLCPDDRERAFGFAVLVRTLFSALVDADFLATERFMAPQRAAERATQQPSMRELKLALDEFLLRKTAVAADSHVNQHRASVLQACRNAAKRTPGVFSLTVPTGGGKTLSSLAFALQHAVSHRLERVICAIPFTSIIEQNADVFREALGAGGRGAVLEHHSTLDAERESRWSRLAAENWDARLVVTTNVQLFESLFAARPSRCRRLHRIARSVVILDEAQTLPVELLHPSLAMLQELTRNYGCSVVLCSATQPAVSERDGFPIGLAGVREIAPDPTTLFEALRRTEPSLVGHLSNSMLVDRLRDEDQVLCIVNTRRRAAELYQSATEDRGNGWFHLSAQMCPEHRSDKIREIRLALERARPCRVISTQLVEAGVDLDFPVVYRALAGLDSIAQAAGRCNREGKLERGRVVVFETEAGASPYVSQAAQDTREIAPDHLDDLLGPDAIEDYFRLHYWKRHDRWDAERVMECFAKGGLHMQFRAAAERYRIIRDEQVSIVVPYRKAGEALIDELKRLTNPPGRGFDRRAQRYVVNVREYVYRRLVENQVITTLHERFHILTDPEAYDDSLGLRTDVSGLDPGRLCI
jgi:CRISPR-associated endonuclease/helicase Cas3